MVTILNLVQLNFLLKNVINTAANSDRSFIANYDKNLLQNASRFLLQNATALLQNAIVLLRNATINKKCDANYKIGRTYFKTL